MKLTSIEIHPANSTDVAVLSFRDPNSINPYNVKAITGLDVDAIIPRHYGSTGISDFYNLSLENRVIVIQVLLNPNFTENMSYSDLRDELYKMIASSRSGQIQIQFFNKFSLIAAVSGLISKFETTMFDKVQGVNITVQCSDPMLKALSAEEIIIEDLTPARFSVDDEKSTAPHGLYFDLSILEYIPSITIRDPDDPSWTFAVAPGTGFLPEDRLIFSSEYNNKQLYVIRSGADIVQLADAIVPGSIWPLMFPGDNTFSFTYDAFLRFNEISYYPTYWGV